MTATAATAANADAATAATAAAALLELATWRFESPTPIKGTKVADFQTCVHSVNGVTAMQLHPAASFSSLSCSADAEP